MLRKCCAVVTLLVLTPAGHGADEPRDRATSKEQRCAARAVAALKQMQRPDGDWEPRDGETPPLPLPFPSEPKRARGLTTALSVLALLDAGVPADDPAVRKGLAFLRDVDLVTTRLVGVQTLALCRAGQERDGKLIRRNVAWLQGGAVRANKVLQGWGESNDPRGKADTWNSHYAVAALHAAEQAGAPAGERWWQDIRGYYLQAQLADGGWGFSAAFPIPDKMRTAAGVGGLLMADAHLGGASEASKRAVRLGAERLTKPFRHEPDPTAIVGLEHRVVLTRLGAPGGQPCDPFRPERAALVKQQNPDGSFSFYGHEKQPALATSYALLFLAAGR